MADKNTTYDKIDFEPIVIDSSETTSAEVDCRGMTLCGVYMPAAFTGTALSFEASADGTTFVSVEDGDGSAVSKTVSASKYIKLDPADFAGVRFIKVVSGSTESAERTLTLALRAV